MDNRNAKLIICPLFYFQISQVLYGNHSPEETKQYFINLRKKIKEGIEILEDIKIRLINKKELDGLRKSPMFGLFDGFFSGLTLRTYILEILVEKGDISQIERRIFHILLALRLFKTGGVFCKIFWEMENFKIGTLAMLDPPIPDYVPFGYSLRIEEVKKLRKLAEKVEKIDFDKRSSLRIACERLNRSYEEHEEDEKLIDFMIAFESLFLKGKTAPANTGHFIGLGCSMLIGKNEKEREKIDNFLVKAYNIRNKIVHGSEFNIPQTKINDEDYEIQDFILQLQNYLRKSIIKMI